MGVAIAVLVLMSTENRECVSREDKAVRQLKLEVRDRAVMPVLLPRREGRVWVAFCISVVKREEDEVLVDDARLLLEDQLDLHLAFLSGVRPLTRACTGAEPVKVAWSAWRGVGRIKV